MRPAEGQIVYRRGSKLRGAYVSARDAVRVLTESGAQDLPYVEGEWDMTQDRPLTGMQVAELKYAALATYRRMLGRHTPDWSMLRDSQRIGFLENGDVQNEMESRIAAAIDGAVKAAE